MTVLVPVTQRMMMTVTAFGEVATGKWTMETLKTRTQTREARLAKLIKELAVVYFGIVGLNE